MNLMTTPETDLQLRPAEPADAPALAALVVRSLRELGREDYAHAQLEASLGTITGVDQQLIADGTLFVIEAPDGALVASGGWSRRAQLYGPSHGEGPGRLLDPAIEAARIRMFFVDPGWARRGLGRQLLGRCEAEARAAGFRRLELAATRMGVRLYAACGYVTLGPIEVVFPSGVTIDGLHMEKRLD